MKTECLQTELDLAFLGEKRKDGVAIIKGLIYTRVGRGA